MRMAQQRAGQLSGMRAPAGRLGISRPAGSGDPKGLEAMVSPVLRPAEDLRTAAKCDLVAEVARTFGEVRLKVTGTSMLPAVWPGDILTVRRRRIAELGPGEIVLCSRNRQLVAHRIVGKCGAVLTTRGDSLAHNDPPVREEEVLGQVVSIVRDGVRDGRKLDPRPVLWRRAGAWILCRSDFSTRVLLRLSRLLRRPVAEEAAWAS